MSKMVDADMFLYLFRQIPFVMEHPEIKEQFEKWVEGLPESNSVDRWITKRLPADETEVFVYLFGDLPYIAWMSEGRWYTDDFEVDEEHYPTAWKPLPELYKEDKEDE